jgi:hypothetical protein
VRPLVRRARFSFVLTTALIASLAGRSAAAAHACGTRGDKCKRAPNHGRQRPAPGHFRALHFAGRSSRGSAEHAALPANDGTERDALNHEPAAHHPASNGTDVRCS